jgi:hypothetical protein
MKLPKALSEIPDFLPEDERRIQERIIAVTRGLTECIARLERELAEARVQVAVLNGLLDRISEESDQPFTETHEHLPDWIKTILQTRPDFSFREGVKAARELDAARAKGGRTR